MRFIGSLSSEECKRRNELRLVNARVAFTLNAFFVNERRSIRNGITMKAQMYFLTCMIFCFAISLQVLAHTFVTDGLVSYWPFDKEHIRNNKAKDVWGENDGTSGGNPKMVTGKVGDALEFDGVEDYVDLTNLGDFGSQLSTSTFEAWIKVGRKNDWMTLFKVVDKGCMRWGFDINRGIKNVLKVAGNPQGEFAKNYIAHLTQFKSKSGCQSNGSMQFAKPISDGKWHHIVYINERVIRNFFGEGIGIEMHQVRLHIDGDKRSTSGRSADSLIILPFIEPVFLGAANNHGKAERFFEGVIDEVRIYNRPLTEDEVVQNYESRTVYSVEPNNKLPITWATLKSEF